MPKRKHNQFSENIRRYREKHNLTQTQLGETLGVRWRTIARWESGRVKPVSPGTLREIAKLGIPLK